MNVDNVIAPGLIESYVLGTGNTKEVTLVQEFSKKHPELVSEIEKVEERLIHFLQKQLNHYERT